MTRALVALALLAVASPARAFDFRATSGADFLLATTPGAGGVAGAELGLTLRADLRDVRKMFDFKLDFMGREAFIGNSTYNNLYELRATARLGRVAISLGRLRAPGGFWLVFDGGMLTVKYTSWLAQTVYGGLRSFTTGRRNTWMSDQPMALPLVGTALTAQHRIFSAQLSFTWARDGIDTHTGLAFLPTRNRIERHIEDEYFLDGYVAIYPHEKVFLTAGASLGTRYDLQFNALSPFGPTTLGVATLGAFGAYGMIEYRPVKRLRLVYSANYERVRILQSQLLATKPDGTPVQAADGSFQDHSLRGMFLAWRALRIELGYRLRARANTDVEHRLSLGARGDDLWRGLGGFASLGVDLNRLNEGLPSTRVHNRIIYNVGLSYVRRWLDLRAGLLFTDGIGSGLLFSTAAVGQSGLAPTQLFPYVLEANRVVYVRFFATFWKMFAGLDVEENLDSVQLRILAQIGAWL
jgi:hypothetical protein